MNGDDHVAYGTHAPFIKVKPLEQMQVVPLSTKFLVVSHVLQTTLVPDRAQVRQFKLAVQAAQVEVEVK